MRWTDYWRIQEQIHLIEESLKWLKKALRYGTQKEIEFEASSVQSNLELLRHIRGHFIDSYFDIRMTKLEKEAKNLLLKANSIIYKKNMEAKENGKTNKNI